MRRLSFIAVIVCAASILAACQGALPRKTETDITPNAVAGDPIEVTALDAPAGETTTPVAAASTAAAAGASDTAEPQADPIRQTDPVAVPSVAEAEPAPKPTLEEAPATPKSERQLACEKKKGRWARVGSGEGRACVYQTKDAGKRCERESQCDSVCLARSGTCAPFKPMYGCNEILQDNGARVTLCLD